MLYANLLSLATANSSSILQNNLAQQYSSSKLNMLYSIRQGLNASHLASAGWYGDMMASRSVVIIVVNVLMMAGTILWVMLLLPYILSVTKINNRVLSLVRMR